MSKQKEVKKPADRSVDPASVEAIEKAEQECATTCFTRIEDQKPQCKFGRTGVCCRLCHMGPCRITAKAPRGVCGADADTIVARNYLREVAGGTAAHSDHARHLVLLLKKVAEGNGGDYTIKDEHILRVYARLYDIEEADRTKEEIAQDLSDLFLSEFTKQEEVLETLTLAPLQRQSLWKQKDVKPHGIDRTCVEALHRTHIGVDHNYKSLLLHAFRTSLSDGWGGSRVATMASDILFGTPEPVRSQANLGVLNEDTVNIIVHGHEPALSEMLAVASQDPDVKKAAHAAGAEGVTLGGICCTANEILMRHGIPIAGNFLQQELAILTGACEMMVIDVQCCMASLPEVAKNYHTEIVSSSDMAHTIGSTHSPFEEDRAYECAKELILRAVGHYKKRDASKVMIPKQKNPLIGGFSVEAIKYMLGGSFRSSFRPLNDAVMQNRIFGICGIVGCSNPKQKLEDYTLTLTKELLKRNVLVLKTGCAAIASGKKGFLRPETALEWAGKGLREVCEAVGMPPVLHMGSCVDNSRLLEAATEVVLEGGLGNDISEVPVAGVAPEWMSEKAVSIGSYFVASGIDVILGNPFHVSGSENANNFLHSESRNYFGASFHLHEDPASALKKIMTILNSRREKLGINRKAERKLMDMKDRRELKERA